MKKRGFHLIGLVLLLALCPLLLAPLVTTGPVDLVTSDGVRIKGTFNCTSGEKKALILLHMMGRTRADWSAFCTAAHGKGFCTLAIDLRGHGESTTTTAGHELNPASFSNAQFAAMVLDVEAAYQYLINEAKIDPEQVAIVGASIGANIAINYAAAHADRIRSVVLLSPGLAYRGVDAQAAVRKYPGAMLFYSSEQDRYSYNSVQALVKLVAPRGEARYYPGGGHGTELLAAHREMTEVILSWLNEHI